MRDTLKMDARVAECLFIMLGILIGAKLALSAIKDWTYSASGYQTENSVELTIVDKESKTTYLNVGKTIVPQYSYYITVDLGDGFTHEFNCTLSEYESTVVGTTRLFTIIKTEDNELVEVQLEH